MPFHSALFLPSTYMLILTLWPFKAPSSVWITLPTLSHWRKGNSFIPECFHRDPAWTCKSPHLDLCHTSKLSHFLSHKQHSHTESSFDLGTEAKELSLHPFYQVQNWDIRGGNRFVSVKVALKGFVSAPYMFHPSPPYLDQKCSQPCCRNYMMLACLFIGMSTDGFVTYTLQ